MSKLDRCRTIVRSMSDEERRELIDWIDDELCDRCAAVEPEGGWDEHDCPFPPTCTCGHAIGDHDEEDPNGRCLAKGEDGKPCDCKEFEEDAGEDEGDEDEDEEA